MAEAGTFNHAGMGARARPTRQSRIYFSPDFRQMMIVMFGDEIEMVHQAHGLFETRMQKSPREQSGFQRIQSPRK